LNPLHGISPEDSESETDLEEALEVRVSLLRNDNVDEGKDLEYTELCQLKQGWVNWVVDYQTPTEEIPNLGNNKLPLITIKKVFAVLNK